MTKYYQNTHDIFQRIRTNNPNSHNEPQIPWIAKADLKKNGAGGVILHFRLY